MAINISFYNRILLKIILDLKVYKTHIFLEYCKDLLLQKKAFTMWPALLEARESVNKIKIKLDMLLKNQNSFGKKEIADHNNLLIEETNSTLEEIEAEMKNISKLLNDHKKYLASKKRFLKRHYKNL